MDPVVCAGDGDEGEVAGSVLPVVVECGGTEALFVRPWIRRTEHWTGT